MVKKLKAGRFYRFVEYAGFEEGWYIGQSEGGPFIFIRLDGIPKYVAPYRLLRDQTERSDNQKDAVVWKKTTSDGYVFHVVRLPIAICNQTNHDFNDSKKWVFAGCRHFTVENARYQWRKKDNDEYGPDIDRTEINKERRAFIKEGLKATKK